MSTSRYVRLVAGLAILAVLVLSVDRQALLDQFISLRVDYLLAAGLCIVIATLLGSFNAYLIVAIDTPVKYGKFLSYFWFSWALGLVVPGQVGDVASLTFLMKRAGLDWTRIVTRALIDKLISFGVMVALAGLALLRFSTSLTLNLPALWLTAVAVAVGAIALFFLVRAYVAQSARGAAIAEKVRSNFTESWAFVRSHSMLVVTNLIGTVIKILLIGSAYWYVFLAGGADEPFWLDIVLLVTVSSLVAYIPISFNGLGTVEVTGILLFSTLGLGSELVLSSYLVLRALVILIAWVPSLPILAGSAKEHR
jgi:uncharacterized membrane protein YbhN (UPF0104 family)